MDLTSEIRFIDQAIQYFMCDSFAFYTYNKFSLSVRVPACLVLSYVLKIVPRTKDR